MHPRTRARGEWLLPVVAAVLVAAALDLLVAVAGGYKLVRPLWALPRGLGAGLLAVGFDVLVLASAIAPAALGVLVLLRLRRRQAGLRPTPRLAIVAVALVPIAAYRVYRTPSDSLGLAVGVVLILAVVAWCEGTGRWGAADRKTWLRAVVLGAAGIFGAVAVSAVPPALVSAPAAGRKGGVAASADRPNLLVIVLDTLRADFLGTYGQQRPTSPWLDSFARRATVFERAIATSSYTLPSHASLFTGLYAESHGARVDRRGFSLGELGLADDPTTVRPLSQEARTLAEIARDEGLETGGICANVAYLSRYFGLDQGFDTWAVPEGGWYSRQPLGLVLGRKLAEHMLPAAWAWWYRSRVVGSSKYYLLASEVNQLALEWLEPRRDRRFLLFLNYMDPHAPYLPPRGYRNLFSHADSPQSVDRQAIESGRREIMDAELEPLVDAYAAEVRYLDDRLRELFARLEAWDLLDRTVVLLAGDHGESFGEHHEMEHATGLHQPQIHVPLILRRPGQSSDQRVGRLVSLVDVLPTLLDLAAFADRPSGLQGVSLLGTGDDRPLPITAALGPYMREWSQRAVFEGDWKLITTSRGEHELYDLAQDPYEWIDRAELEPRRVASLSALLARFDLDARPSFESTETDQMDPATRRRLQALGYLDE